MSEDNKKEEVTDIPETEEAADAVKEETAEAETQTEEAADNASKGGFFKKKKDPRDEKIEELTDRVKRQMAEFENFRKRTEKEKSSMYEMGARDIIERILPVIDNFERGLAVIPEDKKEDPIAEGMEKIYKQIQKVFEEAGVKPIEAAGKEFDPNFHNAVMHVEDESLGENIVAEELQKGYMYRDSVVRHILPVIDNFERGLAVIPEDKKEDPIAEGMEKIYKQIQKVFEEAGVKPIEAAGKEFDPNFHNAVMHVEDESLGENIVAEELQKGYMYRDSVVRHSMVKVAN